MNEHVFAFAAKILKDRAALIFEPDKEYLLESRVTPIAKKLGLKTAEEYLQRIQQTRSEEMIQNLIEAMVTTETMFFRDGTPFESLQKTVLPELIRARSGVRRLNIWCAASSSGQEPYTIAMIIKEFFPELANWSIRLLATDISREMLQRSVEGRYSQFEVNRGVPLALLQKYFQQIGATWQIIEPIRKMVDFQPLNLATNWPLMTTCDLIFLRNVMIYFDTDTKKIILRRMADLLADDGYLILGGAETTFHLVDFFGRADHLQNGFYQVMRGSKLNG